MVAASGIFVIWRERQLGCAASARPKAPPTFLGSKRLEGDDGPGILDTGIT